MTKGLQVSVERAELKIWRQANMGLKPGFFDDRLTSSVTISKISGPICVCVWPMKVSELKGKSASKITLPLVIFKLCNR